MSETFPPGTVRPIRKDPKVPHRSVMNENQGSREIAVSQAPAQE
jgi:hypothetical protein